MVISPLLSLIQDQVKTFQQDLSYGSKEDVTFVSQLMPPVGMIAGGATHED